MWLASALGRPFSKSGARSLEIEMRQGSGFRVIAALVLLGLFAVITAGAYGAGFAAGSSSGTTNIAPWAYGGAFGVGHVVGFIVTIVILVIMLRILALVFFGGHRHRAWGHHGYWRGEGDPGFGPGNMPGGWQRSDWRQAGQAAFDEFHRQAHAGQPPAGGTAAGPGAGAPDPAAGDEPR
jgi:hypothetical protein